MKLEEYKKLVELQLLSDYGLNNILEAKKAYQNNKIDQAFENAKLFKPITDSNKELIDRIEKKTEQSDELIKKITDALPLYNQNTQQVQIQEPLTIDDKTKEPKPTTKILDIMNKFEDNKEELDFINKLMEGENIYLYDKKGEKPNTRENVYSNIKLLNLKELENYSNKEINDFLKSEEMTIFTRKLSSAMRWGNDENKENVKIYLSALKKYKDTLYSHLDSRNYIPKNLPMINEVEGEGIKKKRNGYKIIDSKYNDKLLINMDKLYNNYYVEAKLGDDIIYKNQGDKDTLELLTKSRINKKKKYSKISQQILNDMIILSGMVKNKNNKSRLLGESNIILNNEDRRKRIDLLRGSIIAGNDKEKMNNELKHLTNQENVIQNKSVDDLYKDLKTLTPMLKTSQGDENVYNYVYNIIDYLRTNRHITRDQYHKFIKKHLI